MKIKSDKTSVSAGFSYVEVLVCLLIMTSIIGPICMSFMTSNKVRATAESLEESTAYTEALLERIKQQLTQDIKLKKQKDNGEILEYPAGDNVKRSIAFCLESVYTEGKPLEANLLSDFLWEQDFKAIDQEVMAKNYGSERYAYEIAIWRTANIDGCEDSLAFDTKGLERAVKFYTHPAYCFREREAEQKKIGFKIDKDMKRKFWEAQLEPRDMEGFKIIGEHTITLSEEGMQNVSGKLESTANIKGISYGEKLIMKEPRLIKNNKGLIGIVYTSTMAEDYKPDEISIINVDIRQLLGAQSQILNIPQKLTLTFVNETERSQIIRVIGRRQNEMSIKKDSVIKDDERIEIVAIDKGIHSKTSVEYTQDSGFEENFIIAVVTRDMKPVIGEAGKVVTQMIDIYSYEYK